MEIAASAKSGKSRFEIRLDPADLGRIDVRIDVDRNGQVTSHLTVEKPETLSMLRQDAPQLQRALDAVPAEAKAAAEGVGGRGAKVHWKLHPPILRSVGSTRS